ncbi:ExbD/TolR family protein [Bradyrhizobium sp. HKCCYLS1011]|uniref:ExbD/TolR family protein n=1 Tax=Bradyrhizobium sp. HKCCYLS1011 TaxID=3420733 RepID=UPI003EBB3A0A
MDDEPFETLNVIPFVDIMLVLLTMVLTTANFIATGRIPLALPQASQTKVEKHKDIAIEISASGALAFDGAPVEKDELEGRIKALPADTSFLVRADRTTQFQNFVDVADLLRRLNFSKIAVQTQSTSR